MTAPPTQADDARFMRRALELARLAEGRTAPNPMVGAVCVRDGAVVAEGWHRSPGLPHAEREALAAFGGRAAGATLYVNLEPCCHHGRTPPCTDLLVGAGLARVVVAMVDPDPRVRGRGIAALRAAGIPVEVGLLEAEARRLNAPFLRAQLDGRPLVVLKAGITLDGRIADVQGASRWITGPEARAAGHRLRDRHDAILVGAGTLRADDPALNTRIDGGRDAVPVLLDSRLSIAPDARVLTAGRPPIIYCALDAPERDDLRAVVARVPRSDRGLDLTAVLSDLVSRGVHSVLVEGGGRVHRSLLDAGVVDRIHLFVAPTALAGGPGWLAGPPLALADAPRYAILDATPVGADLHVVLEA